MNQNAEAILILCSRLCVSDGVKPLEAQEWGRLARWLNENGMEPKNLLTFSREDFCGLLHCNHAQADRFLRLIDRSASLGFELSRYASMGIQPITRADEVYPKLLKKKLGTSCPPIFYYAGNLELLKTQSVGYVGSRSIMPPDMEFTAGTVRKTVERGFSVVTGGAKGVDTAAEEECLRQGGCAVIYPADSLVRRIKKKSVLQAVQEGRMVLLTSMNPEAGFQTWFAMARNRLIYCQSQGTVVVRSDLNKGGTWAGAVEALSHQWCPVFCWDHSSYAGNTALIQKGAIPISSSWDGDIQNLPVSQAEQTDERDEWNEQITLFDI